MKHPMHILKMLVPSVLQLVIVACFLIMAIVAYNLGAGSKSGSSHEAKAQPSAPAIRLSSNHPIDTNGDGRIYTCSMHPQIKMDEPGDCPICGMDLVSVQLDESTASSTTGQEKPVSARRLTLSPEAQALASIQTSLVISRVPRRMIRLVGELAVDPSRRKHISADVGGRIDKLSAEYVGDVVKQGDELVLLYSPELLAVQQEFLQAKNALERLPANGLETIRRASEGAVEASRERLRLSGISRELIDAIASSGMAREQVALQAPIGGVVIERHAEQGQYVMKGERILTIASLETLWAEMAAYESDLPWLRVGQQVTFTSEAFPGEKFTGEIAWMDPVTNMRTRTTRVRMNVENAQGVLRPGMYLTARVESTLGEDPKLVVPASAPLITGERAIVYIQIPDVERPTFEGFEVVLGPRVEDGYVVQEGLKEGQRVVTNGSFQIDSALQIMAKPSMMNPDGGIAMTGHEGHGSPPIKMDGEENSGITPSLEPEVSHESHSKMDTEVSFDELIEGYLRVQRALASDDVDGAKQAWGKLAGESAHLTQLMGDADLISGIAELRTAFHKLSQHVVSRAQNQESGIQQELRLVHCPMAFDFAGADWLQAEADVRNPYFGTEMLTCGTVAQKWPIDD